MQDYDSQPTRLTGTVESIIFRNEKNGYTVCEMHDSGEEFIAVGMLPYVQEGEELDLHGRFVIHPDYGQQFQIDEYSRKSFTTQAAVERYLSSGILKGIGPKLAKKLVARFGLETLDIIKNDPLRLTEIKGIRCEKAMEYAAALSKKENIQELILFLASYEIGQSVCLLIEKKFGDAALSQIRENPYCLIMNGWGISFQKADSIALSLGFEPSSNLRIQSAMVSVLFTALANGNTFLPLSGLLSETSKLINQEILETHPGFGVLMKDERIIHLGKERIVALKMAYQTEKAISDAIHARIQRSVASHSKTVLREKVKDLCDRQDIPFDADQIDSLCLCLANPVSIITGGPGTGKTTLVSILCQYMKMNSKTVALAAPTGRAAKKMQEATKTDARTIHRLLEIQYRSDIDDFHLIFARNKDNPVEADMVIIDESSMLDIFLAHHLLEALPKNCILVFIGDENQLPAVGAGNLLKDLIASDRVPVVKLNKVYRQETGSLIVQNSYLILHGETPNYDQTIQSEFMFIRKDSDQDRAQSVMSLCSNILEQRYGIDPVRDVQILTPTRKGACGTRELNLLLQKNLNSLGPPGKPGDEVFHFRRNDKVMQIRNNYETKWISVKTPSITGIGVFNGDTGMITGIEPDSGTVTVLFDEERLVEYNAANIEELELAYAITVHKSQGSEYPVVILVLPDAPNILMTRNLLYTAVSRAKQRLFLVTDKPILARMISNNSITRRNTLLERFMKE